LLQQFLSSNVNQRTDAYGGSIENRVRMPLEMMDAIMAEVGADKTGVRVNPGHTFNELVENDVPELYAHYLEELQTRRLPSPHVVRLFANDSAIDLEAFANQQYNGNTMMSGDYNLASTTKADAERRAAAVAFGKPHISNRDLAERFKTGGPLAECDEATFYAPGPKVYIDYPRYETK